MNSGKPISSTSNMHIQVFRYRWIILLIYGIVSLVNFVQLLQFAIIGKIISKFYNVETYLVDMTVLSFFICFIVLFYPVSYLTEKYNLKFTMVTATVLTLGGNLLKLLATDPGRFWLILLAQVLVAIGQMYLCAIPSKIATTWFGSEEVSTACAIAVLWIQLGSALGSVISPFVVTSDDHDVIKSQLFQMYLYEAIACGCTFAIVLIFFRSRPSLPPSQSQLSLLESNEGLHFNFFNDIKRIVRNKNAWYIILSLGFANGLWNTFGVLTNNVYLNYFPDGQQDAGVIGLITIISGGCVGSMIFGIILDKTHKFKKISFYVLAASAIAFIFVIVSFETKSRIGTYVAIPIWGFFIAPVLILGLEYLVEVTYPIPEACSAAIFNAGYYFLAVLATLLFEVLFDAIGYLYTLILCCCLMGSCALILLLVNSDLKRRDANLQIREVNGNVVENYTTTTISTTVTIAKF